MIAKLPLLETAIFIYVRFHAVTVTSMKFRVFWDVAPCSHIEVDRRFRGSFCLRHQGIHAITLMMKAVRTSETSVNFNVTTQRYIPKTLQTSFLYTFREITLKSVWWKTNFVTFVYSKETSLVDFRCCISRKFTMVYNILADCVLHITKV
jgi:hypothetical protein